MKTEQEIEKILQRPASVSLSASEKTDMKSALISHAQESLRYERPVVSPWSGWLKQASVSFAATVLVMVGTAYASDDSLPGEPLYAVKVHVVEELVGFTKLDTDDKFAYDVALMETRLDELQELTRAEEDPAPETLALVQGQIDEHVDHALNSLNSAEDAETGHEEKIDMLATLGSVAKAQERVVASNARLSSIAQEVSDTRKETGASLQARVSEYVDDSSEAEVAAYLSEAIQEVASGIGQDSASSTEDTPIEKKLHDAEEWLIEKDFDEAIISILEAQQSFDVDAYTEKTDEEAQQKP
jgi:hypothetical protein